MPPTVKSLSPLTMNLGICEVHEANAKGSVRSLINCSSVFKSSNSVLWVMKRDYSPDPPTNNDAARIRLSSAINGTPIRVPIDIP